MSNLRSGKVESVKFSEHVQQNTTKIEELESTVAYLKGDIKSFQENHQHLSNQEKSIPVVDNNSESNLNSEILMIVYPWLHKYQNLLMIVYKEQRM